MKPKSLRRDRWARAPYNGAEIRWLPAGILSPPPLPTIRVFTSLVDFRLFDLYGRQSSFGAMARIGPPCSKGQSLPINLAARSLRRGGPAAIGDRLARHVPGRIVRPASAAPPPLRPSITPQPSRSASRQTACIAVGGKARRRSCRHRSSRRRARGRGCCNGAGGREHGSAGSAAMLRNLRCGGMRGEDT